MPRGVVVSGDEVRASALKLSVPVFQASTSIEIVVVDHAEMDAS
jgi:hypothetical protein